MFTKMQNIDTAFRYIRSVSYLVILGAILLCGWMSYTSYKSNEVSQNRVYVLVNGKALEAYASNRKDNIGVEAKDHIRTFHEYFFTLSPDDKQIEQTISKALYLSDETAKKQYDDLKEKSYFSNIISGNVNQTIRIDSIQLDLNIYPFPFICYATQELTRPTSTIVRNLITKGDLRNVPRSDNNSHGFLLEHWNIIENRDLSTKTR